VDENISTSIKILLFLLLYYFPFFHKQPMRLIDLVKLLLTASIYRDTESAKICDIPHLNMAPPTLLQYPGHHPPFYNSAIHNNKTLTMTQMKRMHHHHDQNN